MDQCRAKIELLYQIFPVQIAFQSCDRVEFDFLRFCNQNRLEFQIQRDWKKPNFLSRDLQL